LQNVAGRLRNRVDLYVKTKTKNALGAYEYVYAKSKSIWVEITPLSGGLKSEQAGTQAVEITHKFLARKLAISSLDNTMYFMYAGQRYDIDYYQPNYKYWDTVDIFTRLVVE
jgi:SPP1 family predicted phage head-tail adaptor